MRRDYDSLVISQVGSAAKVDLTNCFYVGQQPVPIFGSATEVMLPWDDKLENKLELNVTASPASLAHSPSSYGNPYASNPYGPGYGHPGFGGITHPHHAPTNPFAFATISVVGFMHKV